MIRGIKHQARTVSILIRGSNNLVRFFQIFYKFSIITLLLTGYWWDREITSWRSLRCQTPRQEQRNHSRWRCHWGWTCPETGPICQNFERSRIELRQSFRWCFGNRPIHFVWERWTWPSHHCYRVEKQTRTWTSIRWNQCKRRKSRKRYTVR